MIKCWPDYSQQEQDPWRCLSALTPKPTQLWIRFALQCKVQIFSQIFAIIFILTVMVILGVMMMMTWKVIPIDYDHDRWWWWSTWSENVVVDVVATHNLLVFCHPGHMHHDDEFIMKIMIMMALMTMTIKMMIMKFVKMLIKFIFDIHALPSWTHARWWWRSWLWRQWWGWQSW